ncbi:MAG: hypothetical protein O3B75_04090 [Planctomycetota bacterium]|nr:hypothetical protein [Planctomycetota bacterium]
MQQFTIRILTPLLFIATSIGWIMGGTGWVPSWFGNIAKRIGLTEIETIQLVIGVLFAVAGSLLFFGRRSKIGSFFSRFGLVTYAFCCVATLASVMASTPADAGFAPLLYPAIGFAISLALYLIVDRSKSSAVAPSRSAFWIGAGIFALWVLSIGISLRIPVEITAKPNQTPLGNDSVVLDYAQWQGRTLPDTGLSRLLPMLTALTIEGRSIIILYSPECSHCRELFEKYFAVARPDVKVIAVEIPPSPGTTALTGDNLGPVPCAGCERLKLPDGKFYIVKPPTVLVLEEGRVTCSTDSDWKACLGDPIVAATPPASEK